MPSTEHPGEPIHPVLPRSQLLSAIEIETFVANEIF